MRDIHPKTPVASIKREFTSEQLKQGFDVDLVSALVGMSRSFINKVLGARVTCITLAQVLLLLDQDAFAETFVPRSRIPSFLLSAHERPKAGPLPERSFQLVQGNAVDLIASLPPGSVQCVVTSTPYWGMRLYDHAYEHAWADGETCALGSEQTPEGFIRHTVEFLFWLKPALSKTGSVWWNLMDAYNTRTQIRGNAAETLRAMKGQDTKGWKDHACRRYSAGHSFLKDGEQCLIPGRVASRLSRIGYYLKSTIAWKKNGSLPETVESRVTREMEYILHLSIERTPYFDKQAFLRHAPAVGGRNPRFEAEKITDIWHFSTASGLDGHGAQFPVALPGRCIALSTKPGDLVLDPFVGSGTTNVAARLLGRRSIGFDISAKYLAIAKARVEKARLHLVDRESEAEEKRTSIPALQAKLL
ncbi:DNA-methyltransferase [Pyxidicoccus sp. MSG2]|uniref:DNA-methyltransferase n=1 Tax=Pyxidicoccus sp. MSG2 TaxID=2996790 RepID=UPI00227012F3|nr:site-specific DNA-methyltransferase [Pyxidicoccus sp. MSG2]MCY1020418.1 site-specific DNA-methyltransferase [Pyxidicoccus sp. MSG2]